MAENDTTVASEASCAVKLGLYCLVQWCLVSWHKSCDQIQQGRTKADSITGSFDQTVWDILDGLYPTEGEPVYVSMAAGASNKGER